VVCVDERESVGDHVDGMSVDVVVVGVGVVVDVVVEGW
jgi:hypothetical protein